MFDYDKSYIFNLRPWQDGNGNFLCTPTHAAAVCADASNQAEHDAYEKWNANRTLSASYLSSYWLSQMNYYMVTYSGFGSATASKNASSNPPVPPVPQPYVPCN